MTSAYVSLDGGTLRRRGQRLVIGSGHRSHASLRTEGLDQLVVMGNVTLTPRAIDLLVQQDIDTVLLTARGRLRARVGRGLGGNVKLRLAQYQAAGDERLAQHLARRVVHAKLVNQRALLQRSARRQADVRLQAGQTAIKAALGVLDGAVTLNEIRGVEGAAAAAYFKAFAGMIRRPGFGFCRRSRRPPLDPVNALLSLGYTLLTENVRAAIEVAGLDPFLGFLHAPMAQRPSLALDLMEELRPVVVDALVVACLNRGSLRPQDFDDPGEGEPVVIKQRAIKKFFGFYAQRLETRMWYPPLEARLSVRQLMVEQARRLARHIMGEDAFAGFTVR